MRARAASGSRVDEVWRRLDLVTDPELDEPMTDMGFIETVAVSDGGVVQVFFRLPTYWCSPNFAFLMADGVRRAVEGLPWVERCVVQLEDHLCADELNAAVNAGRSFAEAFAQRTGGDTLAAVRETFERKAFDKRQEAVLLGMRAMGFTPADAVSMTLGALDLLVLEDDEGARQAPRYRALLVGRGLAVVGADHAFPDPDGRPLTVEGYAARMSALRSVRINMEFGGALCRGLKRSRYREAPAPGAEPTLMDFIAQAATPAE